MRYMSDPEQNGLFDYYQSILSPVAYKRLLSGYHAVFRHVILSLLPAKELAEHFDESMGRPTKELYSMAGLVLLKEFHDWTTGDATDAYMFDTRVQYALNLGCDNISLSERSLERYMKLIREDELAGEIFDRVTTCLVEELELEVSKQRLDSTHVFSDMATFSRTKLMGVTIKRFLVQLNRHHSSLYKELPEELRARYEKEQNALFADVSKDKDKRSSLRQEVAEQMHSLILRFTGNQNIENMTTFKHLITVFEQQCEVIDTVELPADRADDTDSNDDNPPTEEPAVAVDAIDAGGGSPGTEVKVRKKTGGNVIQNPSDPDATYDGHKGVGYQVQLSETSSSENEVQLIVSAIAETAVESDANAVGKVLEDLEGRGLLPDELTADALYGSDENVLDAEAQGVEIISPVAGPPPKQPPQNPTEKQKRLDMRRKLQETEEWRKKYNSRAQVEGTIGSVKRRSGMVRLRYRGKSSVFTSILLKVAGWNIARAAASEKFQQKLAKLIEDAAQTGKVMVRKVMSLQIHLSHGLERAV